MTRKSTVVIIDDHPLFRDGLKSIIGRDEEFRVAGEAGNGEDGILLIEKLKPDIVTVDIPLPDNDGIKLIERIKKSGISARAMVVSMNFESDYIYEAFNAGARGYMVKSAASENLMDGFHTILKGEYYLDHVIAQHVVKYMIKSSKRLIQISDTRYERLTEREQEITRLMAYGYSDNQIADKLGYNLNSITVSHEEIYKKLGIYNSVDLTRYASIIGLIDEDAWGKNNPEDVEHI